MLMLHYVVRGAVYTDREPLRRFLTTLSRGTWRARFPAPSPLSGHGVGSRLLDVLVDELHVLAVTRLTLSASTTDQAARRLVQRRWPRAVPVVAGIRCTYEIALTDETARSAA